MKKKLPKLILLRHGQSQWNKENLFSGWVDIPLSFEGIHEAIEAGKQIADLPIDLIISSSLIRAEQTAMIAMSVHRGGKIPVLLCSSEKLEGDKPLNWAAIHSPETKKKMIPMFKAWQLNERMYGSLQGCNKEETAKKYGPSQVHIWRRSYDVAPPEGESLKDTVARSIPFFQNKVLAELQKGKNILIVAHGNSLRGLIMEIEKLTPEEILHLELATGKPRVYEYDLEKFGSTDAQAPSFCLWTI